MNTVLPYILYRKKLKMFFIFIYYNTRVRAKIRIYYIIYKINKRKLNKRKEKKEKTGLMPVFSLKIK